MTSITCLVATLLALLTIPLVVLLWITESKQQRAKRLRSNGYTYAQIAQQLNTSPSSARRWAMA